MVAGPILRALLAFPRRRLDRDARRFYRGEFYDRGVSLVGRPATRARLEMVPLS
jgi:hypothetical protein